MAGTVTNQGSLIIATTTTPNNPLNLAGTLTNTGSIIVTGTNGINANANGTTINNQSGATFDFQSGAYLSTNNQTSTAFNNAGTLERTAGSGTASISFPVADSGKIESDSGTLEFTGGGSGGPGIVNAGTGAAVILAGTYSGAFTGSGAGTVYLSDFTGSAATLDFTGTVLEWSPTQDGRTLAGTVTNSGSLTIATTTSPNNPVDFAGTLTNTGFIVVTGTNHILANANGATINNQAGGTFDFQGGSYLDSNGETGTVFNNAGTLSDSASDRHDLVSGERFGNHPGQRRRPLPDRRRQRRQRHEPGNRQCRGRIDSGAQRNLLRVIHRVRHRRGGSLQFHRHQRDA